MKKTLYILAALVFSLVAVSCDVTFDKILEETPKGQVLTNSAFTHASDLESALGVLRYKVSRGTFYDTCWPSSMMGDDLATHPKSNKALSRELDVFEVSTGNGVVNMGWSTRWLIIKAANFIINGAEQTPDVTEAEITNAINVAKFWRAWAYFGLVRDFGPLPLVTSLDIDYGTGLTSVAGIYEQIIKDLTDATALPAINTQGLIPEVSSSVTQDPNSGAAHAMLSCVYLNMAGWPLNKGSEYYKLAAEEAAKVINGGYYYKLYDDYRDIHSVAHNWDNTEAIISVYYNDSAGTDGDSSLMTRGGISDFPDNTAGAYNNTRGELKFYYEFPEGYRKTIVYPPHCKVDNNPVPFWDASIVADEQFPYFGEKAWPNKGEYAGKEFNPNIRWGNQCNGWDMQNHMLIRLSEVYCWYAEGLARSGGDLNEAAKYLNLVRNRADGPGATTNMYSASMGAEALAEAAYKEHRWEIAGWWPAVESCYSDMVRMKRAEEHFNYRRNPKSFTFGGKACTEPYGPVGSWDDSMMFLPYPEQETLRNPNLNIDPKLKITEPYLNGTEVIKVSE